MANTSITTVVTSQAPDAKPISKNIHLTTNWQTLIEVPNYEVPELVFGGSTTIENGVGEVISPLFLCNHSSNTTLVDVRSYRYIENDTYWIVRNMPLPPNDTFPLPLNGQFFKSGDLLEIKASEDYMIDAMLSFTLGQAEEDDV